MNCSHLLSFSHKSVLYLNPVPRSTRQVAFLPVSVDRGPRAGPVARAQEWDQALSEFPGFREDLILISLFVRKRDRAQVNGPSLSPPPSPTAGSSPHGHALSSTVYRTRAITPGPSPLAPPLHACSQPTEDQSETDSLLVALSTNLSVPQFPDPKNTFLAGLTKGLYDGVMPATVPGAQEVPRRALAIIHHSPASALWQGPAYLLSQHLQDILHALSVSLKIYH